MDLGNVGVPELVMILIVGLVVLGPRELVKFAREVAKLLNQLRALVGDVQQQLDLELALQEGSKRRSASLASGENRSKFELPEVYRRFREDFPEEGLPDDSPDVTVREDGQAAQERRVEVTAGATPGDGTRLESARDIGLMIRDAWGVMREGIVHASRLLFRKRRYSPCHSDWGVPNSSSCWSSS